MNSPRIFLIVAVATLTLLPNLPAEEWKVTGVDGGNVTVARTSGDNPRAGDIVAISFVIPGLGEKAKKAEGKIAAIVGNSFEVKIDAVTQTGKITPGDVVEVIRAAPPGPASPANAGRDTWAHRMADILTRAENGSGPDAWLVSEAFRLGVGLPRDLSQSGQWLERALRCETIPGVALHSNASRLWGPRKTRDQSYSHFKTAFDVLQKEAESGAPEAMHLLSDYYDDFGIERVVPENRERERYWRQKGLAMWKERAANSDAKTASGEINPVLSVRADAAYRLSYYRFRRLKDYQSALPYLEIAAEAGDPRALTILGEAYAWALEKNPAKAAPFYRQAAMLGDTEAAGELSNVLIAIDPVKNREEALCWGVLAWKFGGQLARLQGVPTAGIDLLKSSVTRAEFAAATQRAKPLLDSIFPPKTLPLFLAMAERDEVKQFLAELDP